MKAEEKAKELYPLNEIAERKLKELRDADKYMGTDDSKDAITVMKEAMEEFAQQSTNQDKVREAAEKVYQKHEELKTSLLEIGDEPDLLSFELAMYMLGVELTKNK